MLGLIFRWRRCEEAEGRSVFEKLSILHDATSKEGSAWLILAVTSDTEHTEHYQIELGWSSIIWRVAVVFICKIYYRRLCSGLTTIVKIITESAWPRWGSKNDVQASEKVTWLRWGSQIKGKHVPYQQGIQPWSLLYGVMWDILHYSQKWSEPISWKTS